MKLTELIEEATKALEEHGDIPVIGNESGCGCFAIEPAPGSVEIVTDISVQGKVIPIAFFVEGY